MPLFLSFAALSAAASLWLAQDIFPAEDALILFRYARHLGQEGQIAFNQGGPPTEGATDFLWMCLIALGENLGLAPYCSALLLSCIGLLSMNLLLFFSSQKHIFPFALAGLSLLLAPQWWAAIQGFSPYFFGMALMGSLLAFADAKSAAFVFWGLIACLTRPDGIVLVLPLGIAFFFFSKNKKKDLLILLSGGLLPALLYFYWRMNYFGELLPLPFYVKALQEKFLWIFDPNSLTYLATYLLRYLSPLLIPLFLGFRRFEPRLKALFLISLLAPCLFYSTIALEQNVAHRLLMPLLIGVLTAFFLAWYQLKWFRLAGIGIYLALSLFYSTVYFARSLPLKHDLYPHLGQFMASRPGRLATTEAGRIPYYSEWESLDLWGLNSPELSKKLVEKEDLAAFQPDIILLDDGRWDFNEMYHSIKRPYRRKKTWDFMVFNALKFGIESGDYELWWVPYQKEAESTGGLEKFLYDFFPNPYTDRIDLWLLHKDYSYRDELIPFLQSKGARPFEVPKKQRPKDRNW